MHYPTCSSSHFCNLPLAATADTSFSPNLLDSNCQRVSRRCENSPVAGMAELRHAAPASMDGMLEKEGRFFKSRHPRFLRLRGSILSCHHAEDSPATWEVNVAEQPVTVGPKRHELIVTFPLRKVSYFAANDDDFKNWAAALKRAAKSEVEDFYAMGEVLGEGAFAQVKLGVDRETGEKFAIKIIKRKEYDPKEMDFLLREVSILKSVSHTNIVNTYDVFESKDSLHLVLEYMEGGELFDIIADAGHFSEQAASQVMREVVKGVQYLHMNSIVHRDLKPENVLCANSDFPLQIKLADFGLANFAEDGTIQESNSTDGCMIGTPGYVAPEAVKREPYGPPVDMWACGVLLYIMLSGKVRV
jgi:tRNA A-37 threonylcarbamoyl transferase component Bud32